MCGTDLVTSQGRVHNKYRQGKFAPMPLCHPLLQRPAQGLPLQRLVVLIALATVGCGDAQSSLQTGAAALPLPDPFGGQTGAETLPACRPRDVSEIALEQNESGFSARDVLDRLGMPLSGRWLWHDGSSSHGRVDVQPTSGVATLQRFEPVGHPDGGVATDCDARVLVDVELTLETDDGRLDEAFGLTLMATSARQTSGVAPVPLDGLRGTWQPESLPVQSGETLSLYVVIEVNEAELQIALEAQMESGEPNAPEGQLSRVRSVDVGRFMP